MRFWWKSLVFLVASSLGMVLASYCLAQPADEDLAWVKLRMPKSAPGWVKPEDIGIVMNQLREGGYILLMRHGTTDHSQEDMPKIDFEDCDTQRNLTDIGRLNASGWGKVLRDSEVPVAQVISGRYCRTRETAEGLGFKSTVIDSRLNAPGREDSEQRREDLLEMVRTVPPKGANVVLVTHSANMVSVFGDEVAGTAEADVVVVRPSPSGTRASIVAKLHITDVSKWRQASALGRR